MILLGGLLLIPTLAQAQVDVWGYLHSYDSTVTIATATFLWGLRQPVNELTPGWTSSEGDTATFHFSPLPRWPDLGVCLLTYFGGQPVIAESLLPMAEDRWTTVRVSLSTSFDSFAVLFTRREIVGLQERLEPSPRNLIGAAPNPFRAATTIRFSLPAAADVDLAIMNSAGARVRTLTAGRLAAGAHGVTWNALDDARRPVESGVYFCRLSTPGLTLTEKLILSP